MSPSSDYTSAPSSGRLKLKGVKDSKVDKKRSKKKKHHTEENASGEDKQKASDLNDKSVALRSLEDEDAVMTKEKHREVAMVDGKEVAPGSGVEDESLGERIKTDAEKRYDEQRRKRLDERLKREGVKTHKQRVEDLNRYLSGLSEHHDMPRIGPG